MSNKKWSPYCLGIGIIFICKCVRKSPWDLGLHCYSIYGNAIGFTSMILQNNVSNPVREWTTENSLQFLKKRLKITTLVPRNSVHLLLKQPRR